MAIDPAKPFDLEYRVDASQDRFRLDLFIRTMIPSMSRTRIQQRISEGRILVNGVVRSAPSWRVLAGDDILVRCPAPDNARELALAIPLDILYEDDDIIVINKQPGLVVHPVGKHRHDTLLNALYWRFADIPGAADALSLANRLDQYTSGVILAAKNTEAKRILQESFEERVPQKTYIALCRGALPGDSGDIDLPIGPAEDGDHCRMAVRADALGKPSFTHWMTEQRFARFTLVRLQPRTGRQHQLRVHMSALGYPLAADARYGGGCRLELRTPQGGLVTLDRYALHAASLTFVHPSTGKELTCNAPLAADLQTAVDALAAGAVEEVGGAPV